LQAAESRIQESESRIF